MDKYNISNDFLEIVAGTTNRISPVYKEAASAVDSANDKGINYLRNFLISIDKVASSSKVKDERISASKGNIKSFAGYNDIVSVMEFLKKNLSGVETVADCIKVFDKLEEFAPLYADGYSNGVDIIKLEYESALYMLITSLSMLMANNIEMVSNGTQIKIQKKKKETFGVIPKTMHDLAIQLTNKDHKEYLESLMKVVNSKEYKESVTYMEGATIHDTIQTIKDILTGGYGVVSKSFKMIKSIKASMFGIIPLIRSIVYLKYKKKADTIVRLEEQAAFIKLNIEQLNNRTNIDEKEKEKIIKKQEAACEKYLKKAEKLRAELCETEKAAVTELKKDEPNLKDTTSSDDEFILEAFSNDKKKIVKNKNVFNRDQISKYRKEQMSEQFFGLFKKKSNAQPVKQEAELTAEDKEKIDDILKKIYDAFNMDSIYLDPGTPRDKDDDIENRIKTKIGGVPYWPQGMKWPMHDEDDMIFLAQLNFSELPKLEGFPTTGILQFFIVDLESEEVRVIYHEKVVSKNEYAGVNLANTTLGDLGYDFPITSSVYFPTAKNEKVLPSFYDSEDLEKELVKMMNQTFNEEWKEYNDIPKEKLDYLRKRYFDQFSLDGCRVAGYPLFTQQNITDDKTDVQLLQLDSVAHMMWGDCGVAHVFTSKNALKSLDFDGKAMFYWDCL